MIRLFAPTTVDKAEIVLRNGLKNVCDLTDEWYIAEAVAYDLSSERGQMPAILEVTVDPRDLEVQWAAIEDPPASAAEEYGIGDHDEWHEALEAGDIPKPKHDRDWKTALDVVHWVCHSGRVPPSAIRWAEEQPGDRGEAPEDLGDSASRKFEHPDSQI